MQTPFTHDATKNLNVLLTTDLGSAGDNTVSAMLDAARYPSFTAGGNDNATDTTGTPTWGYHGIVNIRLGVTR